MSKLLALIAVISIGCTSKDPALDRRLDDLSKKLDNLDQKVSTLAAPAARARPPRRPEPDPRDVYAVPVDGDPSVGPADALVTIVDGYEYACPYCEKIRPTLAELRARYGDKLRIVYKQYLVHPQIATEPARAACAAHEQGKFAELDALLWDKAFGKRAFDRATIEALAGEAGLDLARFARDRDGACVDEVAADHAALRAVGQGGTPTFYINGRYLAGPRSIDAFTKVIDEELALAERRVAEGTPPARYYQTWVVDRGLKSFTPKRT